MSGKRLKASALAAGALFCLLTSQAFAQAAYAPPRTPDGKPDFQGVWTNASLSTLERSAQYKTVVIPPEQAAAIEAQRARIMQLQNARTETETAPAASNSSQVIGGYNAFWLDGGDRLAVVRGETRSAWVIDPPSGRIPYSEEGKAAFAAAHKRAENDFNGPEARTPADRCLVGFGSTGAPPMQNVMYNNNYQIVQTPDHLVILVEMNHDARVIPIGGEHRPAALTSWLGDSVAHWEGDTLVVETLNVHPENAVRPTGAQSFYVGDAARVTERFTRVGADEILYEFAVEDPVAFTQSWKGEMPLRTSPGPVYEYACHEGNYALPGMLAGARRYEALERSNALTYYAKVPR